MSTQDTHKEVQNKILILEAEYKAEKDKILANLDKLRDEFYEKISKVREGCEHEYTHMFGTPATYICRHCGKTRRSDTFNI